MIGEDDVPRLLAADIAAAAPHLLEHVAVADLGSQELQPGLAELPLETKIGHAGRELEERPRPELKDIWKTWTPPAV